MGIMGIMDTMAITEEVITAIMGVIMEEPYPSVLGVLI
jgi:hypothetical protein